MRQPVLKHRPEEFRVVESLVLPHDDADGRRFGYLRLTKSGYTTFEAIHEIARQFDVPAQRIAAAGLKDEDAITEQLISIEGGASPTRLGAFNRRHNSDPRRFMRLESYGGGDEPLRTGQLTGNSFRVVVRNVSKRFVERIGAVARHTFYFLNYYGPQRFGVAGGPKTSHRIGEALARGDHARALEILRVAETPESREALHFEGPPHRFFDQLDSRLVDFFLSAHASYGWNAKLAELVRGTCGDDAYPVSVESIPFTLASRQSEVLAVLARELELEYPRFYGDRRPGRRATAVQVQLHCTGVGEDDQFPGARRCDLSFFLPSGCYATICIEQLVRAIDPAPARRGDRVPERAGRPQAGPGGLDA